MSEEEVKKEEQEHKEDEEKKDVDWEEQASDDEEELENDKEKENSENKENKPKREKIKKINGEIMITKLDEYIEPPKEVKEAKGDVRDANKYNLNTLINKDE